MTAHVSPNALTQSGLWGYSTPAAFENYMIFCVGNDKVREAQFRSWATSNGIGFKSLHGCYKGQQEASFIINMRDSARCFAWYSKEESVLLLGPSYREGSSHGNREAHLYYLSTGHLEDLGLYQWVPRDEGLREDAWTYDPTQDEYFVCRPKSQMEG